MTINPHFQFVTEDGTIMTRSDGSIMEFRPSAYLGLTSQDDFIFVRDFRARKLQFLGGGVDIKFSNTTRELRYEMPDKAAAREAFEEAGVDSDPQNFSFVGQFSMLEPSFLYLTVCWSLPYGDFVMQPDEVSEIVRVPYTEVRNLETRQKWVGEFYPAQWTMFGWLMCHIYYDKRPVFHPWRDEDSDGWAKFDSRS